MENIVNIVNVKIWFNKEILDYGITIVGNRIAKIGKESTLLKAEKTFDAGGRLLLPGFIDIHTHLRDFDFAYKEDFSSGTAAAVAGGFTTVLDMPNSKPPTMTPEILKARIKRAKARLFCDVGFYATPKRAEQVENLVDSGCIAVKIYLAKPLDFERYSTEREIYELIKNTSKADLVLSVHAENPNMIKGLEGETSAFLHAKSHPIKSEISAIDMMIRAAQRSRGKLHICHLSTFEGLNKIRRAKKMGVDVTCETTPHHATLSEKDFERLGNISIIEPPLRSKRHNEAMLKGISNGDIDILATDHSPHTLEEKDIGTPGFPGLETAIPIFFTLVKEGVLPLDKVIDTFTIKPAERFSLHNIGKIEIGKMANFTIIDLKKERKINSKNFFSKSKFSPFDGTIVKAGIYATFVRGREVFLDGEVISSEKVGRTING